MTSRVHEIRDPIHGFILFDDFEREVINSRPVQRLRDIKQLGTTYLLYPGATHVRFEHALGVMHLATRVFDLVRREDRCDGQIADEMGWRGHDSPTTVERHRRTLRLAALLHDIGHLPFSHTSERLCSERRPGHESYTENLMRQGWLADLLAHCPVHVDVRDVVSVALGGAASHADRADLSHYQAQVLSDMIAGDLGADRMDYLLRDAHHTGAAYGRFDIERLVHTLRLTHDPAGNPMYAIEEGGVHAAEGLILARYFMFEQVYHHHVRRVYDLHLGDFLGTWLPGGVFPVDLDVFLSLQDSHVNVAMAEAAANGRNPGRDHARRILERDHFRLAYEVRPEDEGTLVGLFDYIRNELCRCDEGLLFDDLKREETTLRIPYVGRDDKPGKVEERSGVSSLITFPHRRVFAPQEQVEEIRSRCENIAATLREARNGQG